MYHFPALFLQLFYGQCYFRLLQICLFLETNQDHRLSRWFALPLEGAITGCACKRIESPPSALLSQLPPLAAIFIITLVLKAAKQPLTTARSAGEIKA